MQSAPRTTSSAWINIGNGKPSSSWVQQLSENMQDTGPCAHILNPKSLGFDRMSRITVLPSLSHSDHGFSFCTPTHPDTQPYTYSRNFVSHFICIRSRAPAFYQQIEQPRVQTARQESFAGSNAPRGGHKFLTTRSADARYVCGS